jgi:hypothetical protein
MGAMRQNMNKLQDMLRQMQEQHQAYEAAKQVKPAPSAPHPVSTAMVTTQAFGQAVQPLAAQASAVSRQVYQAPVYVAKAASTVTARPAPHTFTALVWLATAQIQPAKHIQAQHAAMEATSTLQAQFHAFLQQLNLPLHNISKSTPSANAVGSSSQGAPVWQPSSQFGVTHQANQSSQGAPNWQLPSQFGTAHKANQVKGQWPSNKYQTSNRTP